MQQEFELADATATENLAARLAAKLPADTDGWLLLLQGDLGAGKSTFARSMLHSLGHDGPVPSPTYTLVEPYSINGRQLYHIDLYRIADADELEFLGWQDLRDGFCLVEWPERAAGLTAAADLRLTLDFADDGRKATLSAESERAAEMFRDDDE